MIIFWKSSYCKNDHFLFHFHFYFSMSFQALLQQPQCSHVLGGVEWSNVRAVI